MALLIRKWKEHRQPLRRLCFGLILTGLLLALAGLPFGIQTRMTPAGEALQWVPWNLWSGGVLGIFLLVGTSSHRKWVAPRVLIFFGKISYGLYLYHLFVFTFYRWVLKRADFASWFGMSEWMSTWLFLVCAGLVSIAIASFSRTFFEEPFLRLKDRWRLKTVAPV
jgi:peptidoglycan/LPS O-acetylase OafA/YrhL